jgi:2-aminoadipate transaminase
MKQAEVLDGSLPLVQFFTRPGIIDLAWGHPDPELLPVEGLRQAAVRVFDRYGADALNYGYAAGPGPLISWLGYRIGEVDARAAKPDELVITGGSSQALDQVATLFTKPGDVVLVELPTYHLAVRILRDHPVEVIGVTTDDQGLRIDQLKKTLGELRTRDRRVGFLYTIPTFHNPTGVSMTSERRRELLDIATAEGLLIVEDDAYRELSYDGPALPSLWSLAPPSVIRLGTFTKSLAPGLRSGFMTSDSETIGRIRASGVLDSGGGISHFSSLVVAEFASNGDYARNVDRLRAAYRQRRDALLSALAEHLDGKVSWQRPGGGYFVWLTLTAGPRTTELLRVAEAQGTSFMPGDVFYLPGSPASPTIRLSFSRYQPELLVEAARRLGRAFQR